MMLSFIPFWPAWSFLFHCYMFLPVFILSTVSRVSIEYILPTGWVQASKIVMNDAQYSQAVEQVHTFINFILNFEGWVYGWNVVMVVHQVWIHLTSFLYWALVVFMVMVIGKQLVYISHFLIGVLYIEPILQLWEHMDQFILRLTPNCFRPYLFSKKF